MKPGKTGLKRIIDAGAYSMLGLRRAWKHEAAFRQECYLAMILIPLTFFVGKTATQICILLFPIFLLLIVELLNSAIEAAVDRVSDELHVLSGAAKDMGSAAVFICLILLLLVWCVILLERFNV